MAAGRRGLPWVWGATPAEVARAWPADDVVPGPAAALTRAVTVRAPAATAYRWLCQLSQAPYSYDLVDNLGRRSPRTLTPGAEQVAVGDRMVMIYEVTEVHPGRSWSGRTTASASRPLGPVGVTYAAVPDGDDACRLVCRMTVRAGTPLQRAAALALAWGDLVMLRKQLLTLARLAEATARSEQQ